MSYLLNWLCRKRQWQRKGKASLNTSGYWVANSLLQLHNTLWSGNHHKNTVCELSPIQMQILKRWPSGGRQKKKVKEERVTHNQMHTVLLGSFRSSLPGTHTHCPPPSILVISHWSSAEMVSIQMKQGSQSQSLGQPRGMGGMWRKVQDGGTHVHVWLIHVDVWQKPPQYCKVISLQLN